MVVNRWLQTTCDIQFLGDGVSEQFFLPSSTTRVNYTGYNLTYHNIPHYQLGDNKCMIFKCYSSENLIALNTLHKVVPPDTHFTAESTEAMQIKCLAQGHNILMPGFEPSTSVS